MEACTRIALGDWRFRSERHDSAPMRVHAPTASFAGDTALRYSGWPANSGVASSAHCGCASDCET